VGVDQTRLSQFMVMPERIRTVTPKAGTWTAAVQRFLRMASPFSEGHGAPRSSMDTPCANTSAATSRQ
jgi:hypothetical protein